MKPTIVRIGWVVLLVLVASSSEAGLFKRSPGKYKAPTAASPLNQGADETHKSNRAPHKPARYQRVEWGNIWKQSLRLKEAPTTPHYNEF